MLKGEKRRKPMLEARGLFALVYSPEEKAYRIEDLEMVLRCNIAWFARGEVGKDYGILAISESREQLRGFWKSLVKQKETIG
jgi:hypothetical protein